MNLGSRRRIFACCGLFALCTLRGAGMAAADAIASPWSEFSGWKPSADLRLRFEEVGQVPIQEDAHAVTLRARLGLQTPQVWNTTVLAEGNFLLPLKDQYRPDPAVQRWTQYPVVADPRDHELNRLQLSNTSLPQTTVTFGRQRILLDDQRFVGNSGWRQDEQTFDGVRVVNQTVPGLSVDVTYIDRVHRVYAQDSPQGTYDGSVFLANAGYQTPIGKLTGFAYLMSFDPITAFPGLAPAAAAALNPVLASTSTYGGRLAGQRTLGPVKIGYVASYADQRQRGDNPHVFDNDYYLGELSATIGPVTGVLGDEIMQGNGIIGFATPLATAHAFDGWADKFLTTPANGLKNRYASLSYVLPAWGSVRTLAAKAVYRRFAPEHAAGDYGSEWDLQLSGKWSRYTPSVVFADYRAAASTPTSIARDTRKLFVQLECSL